MHLIVSEVFDSSSHTDKVACLGIDDVISSDLLELGEMPSVPFLQSHGVVVKLFVKIFKEGDSLDNHSVDLVRREGKLVARHAMGKTELHGLELISVFESADEALHLESDASHHFVGFVSSLALDSKLFEDSLTEFLIGNEELVFDSFLNNVFVQKLRQTLRKFTLEKLFKRFHSIFSVLEFGE